MVHRSPSTSSARTMGQYWAYVRMSPVSRPRPAPPAEGSFSELAGPRGLRTVERRRGRRAAAQEADMTTIDARTPGTDSRTGSGTYPTPARPDDARFVGAGRRDRRRRGRARARPRPRRHVRGRGVRRHARDRLPGPGRARGARRRRRHLAPGLLRPGRAGPPRRRHRAGGRRCTSTSPPMQAFRRRARAADAEGVLRRVADEGLVIATSGGSDWLWPTTTAATDDDGFRVSGRKAFCSQAPGATVLATSAVLRRARRRRRGGPLLACRSARRGVRIVETWDTLGMRGTASHDLVLDDVEVPAERIAGRRPVGRARRRRCWLAGIHFAPGRRRHLPRHRRGARDVAVEGARRRRPGPAARRSTLPRSSARSGLMDAKLRRRWWALLGALDEVGDDYRRRRRQTLRDGDAGQAAGRDRGHRGRRPGHGRARRPLVLPALAPRAGATATCGPARSTRSAPEVTLAYAGKLALGDPGLVE